MLNSNRAGVGKQCATNCLVSFRSLAREAGPASLGYLEPSDCAACFSLDKFSQDCKGTGESAIPCKGALHLEWAGLQVVPGARRKAPIGRGSVTGWGRSFPGAYRGGGVCRPCQFRSVCPLPSVPWTGFESPAKAFPPLYGPRSSAGWYPTPLDTPFCGASHLRRLRRSSCVSLVVL